MPLDARVFDLLANLNALGGPRPSGVYFLDPMADRNRIDRVNDDRVIPAVLLSECHNPAEGFV